jgi:hypothetical protein
MTREILNLTQGKKNERFRLLPSEGRGHEQILMNELLQKALEVGEKRRKLLEEMRAAIDIGDKDIVFKIAIKLTGLSDEKRYRIGASFNRGAS